MKLAAELDLSPEVLDQIADLVADRLADKLTPWPEWMNVETAARYLDCGIGRLQKLKERDAIPYVQDGPGGRVFHRRTDLDAWMGAKRCD